MSEFWIFTLSGAIVGWVPILATFLVSHWRLRVYIDRKTNSQTSDINGHVKAVAEVQTEELLQARQQPAPGRRRRRDRRYSGG